MKGVISEDLLAEYESVRESYERLETEAHITAEVLDREGQQRRIERMKMSYLRLSMEEGGQLGETFGRMERMDSSTTNLWFCLCQSKNSNE